MKIVIGIFTIMLILSIFFVYVPIDQKHNDIVTFDRIMDFINNFEYTFQIELDTDPWYIEGDWGAFESFRNAFNYIIKIFEYLFKALGVIGMGIMNAITFFWKIITTI